MKTQKTDVSGHGKCERRNERKLHHDKDKGMDKNWEQICDSVIQNNYSAYNILQEIIDSQ